MRWQDNNTPIADIVTIVADYLNPIVRDRPNGITIVWVAKDHN